jgi:hypothetical protein
MSRRVRRNALVEASEPHQKERLGLLSVNEKDLGTVKRPSTRYWRSASWLLDSGS